MGLVEVHGEIKLSTFYYKGGQSDADTVKLDIENGFARFRANKNTGWKNVTHILLEGKINSNPVIKVYKNSAVKRLTVRLQGIDAPELHFRADSRKLGKNIKEKWDYTDYRQRGGAKATWELVNKIEEYKDPHKDIVKAHTLSRVKSPNDAFDVHGRFVGDVVIKRNGKPDLNINRWLIEQGWAFPAFYNSMTEQEINAIIEKSQKPKPDQAISKDYSSRLLPFNANLKFVKNPPIDHTNDNGPVNYPKIFRRLIQFKVGKKAGAYEQPNLREYLLRTSNKDFCYETDEFLKKGENATKHRLGKFVSKKGVIGFKPHEIVIIEDLSADLLDKDGRVIESWNHS